MFNLLLQEYNVIIKAVKKESFWVKLTANVMEWHMHFLPSWLHPFLNGFICSTCDQVKMELFGVELNQGLIW